MVPTEHVHGLTLPPDAIRGVVADRTAAGKWRLSFAVDTSFRLADGREIVFDKTVTLSGHQKGRKRTAADWKPWEYRKAAKAKRRAK